MEINSFENRHIGANQDDIKKMLNTIGLDSVDELIHQTIPNSILKNSPLKIEDAITENDYLTKYIFSMPLFLALTSPRNSKSN